MRSFFFPVLVAVLLAVPGLRAGSWESAYRARAWLGPGVPTRIVQIRNAATRGSHYPAEFYGLVITIADIVWLYTEFDGTQNLSLERGQVEEDHARLGALLQAVEPGLVGFIDVTDRPLSSSAKLPALPPNACFLACVVRWQELQRGASPPSRVRLLACYPPGGGSGHMLLEFWRQDRRYVFDPDWPTELLPVGHWVGNAPLDVAVAALKSRTPIRPVKATPLELPVRSPPGTRVAGESAPPSRT